MNDFSLKEDNSKLLSIAISVFALAVALLIFEPWVYFTEKEDSSQRIGKITYLQKDVRFKQSNKTYWQDAQSSSVMRTGYSLYSGENSQATVQLDSGSDLLVSENSLITFSENMNLLALQEGLFAFKVNGNLRFVSGGKITQLAGTGSEVQLKNDKNGNVQLVVVSGIVDVRRDNKTKRLNKNQGVKFNPKTPALLPFVSPSLMNSVDPSPQSQPLIVDTAKKTFPFFYLYHHFYENKDRRPYHLPFPLIKNVNARVILNWQGIGGPYKIEISDDPLFGNVLVSQLVDSEVFESPFTRIGRFFWRVRREPKTGFKSQWSTVNQFEVTGAYLSSSPQLLNATVEPIETDSSHTLQWQNSPGLEKSLVEISTEPSFSPENSTLFFVNQPQLTIQSQKVGSVYWRVQAISEKTELSEWSEIGSYTVSEPQRLPAPKLPKRKILLSHDLKIRKPLRWSKVPKARSYQIEIIDSNSHVIKSYQEDKNNFFSLERTPGIYRYRVAAIDKYQRLGFKSLWKPFKVNSAPLRLAKKQKQIEKEIKRKIASKERKKKKRKKRQAKVTSRFKQQDIAESYTNSSYKKSYIQIDGTSSLLVSSEQDFDFSQSPLSLSTVVRSMYWWLPKHGVEGSLRTKLVGYNDNGKNISPLSAKVRYHYRWIWPFKWLNFIKQMQLSLFTGLQTWRNSQSGGLQLFSPNYQLVDLGFTLRMQLWQNWDAGGEVAYGFGFDGSKKFELAGFLNYYFDPTWSFGLGYRVHLFEAGSLSASPAELPFREAFGEGYGSLKRTF